MVYAQRAYTSGTGSQWTDDVSISTRQADLKDDSLSVRMQLTQIIPLSSEQSQENLTRRYLYKNEISWNFLGYVDVCLA